MKRLRWRRIIGLLSALVVVAALGNIGVRYFATDDINAPLGQNVVREDLSLNQQRKIIENARNAAQEAAGASGQSPTQIEKFAVQAEDAAQQSFIRPAAPKLSE